MRKRICFLIILVLLMTGLIVSAEETVEITFWHVWSEVDSGPIEARIEEFNEMQNDIHVKILGNQDPTKQLTAMSGGNPPDLALTFWNNLGPWSDSGAVLDLTEYIEKENYNTSNLIPAALERMKVDDKYYGLPFTMSIASKLMYNKDVLAEAGLSEPPETLEELFDYSKKLTIEEDGKITQIGFIPDYPWIDNVFWPVIFGGSFYDEETGEITANSQENIDAIAYQAKFYEEFGEDAISKYRSGMGQRDTSSDPLVNGELAMIIGWEYNYAEDRGEDGIIGVVDFPYPEDRPDLAGSGMVSPRAIFIPSNAEHKDEAWELMKYLVSEEAQINQSIESDTIPTTISALHNPRLTKNEEVKELWEFFEAAKDENLQGFPNSVYINQYLQALTEQTEKALIGDISAEEAMNNVKEEIQPLADEENN
ncbi:MAG: ABC transporter substrate-binding protein [Halanaerobiales bacterium]